MFDLETITLLLLIISLIAACGFEFVNGFHDTANAVATVIYTHSLKPWVAVVWSGFCNFLGVFAGGIGVAMSIVNLLPVELLVNQDVYQSMAMIMALLISAIFWNLGTWYLGLPASSTHTLVGSILGVGIAYSLLPDVEHEVVNWQKASEMGLSLLISPTIGFCLTIFLMFMMKRLVKNPKLYKEPHKNHKPPTWIRSMLILTCTGVSFSHGSNDGQKGVGLVMLILIGIVPTYFALDQSKRVADLHRPLDRIELMVSHINPEELSLKDRKKLQQTKDELVETKLILKSNSNTIPKEKKYIVRKNILLIQSHVKLITSQPLISISKTEIKQLKDECKNLRQHTDYAPFWVLLMISISLGLGTMIGWKRIVKTVGEKIGKTHMTYAQGTCAEFTAASTIGMSTFLGLPVSTTHVLSSGIAGSMVASRGLGNLQGNTVRNILMAWVLTLPVVMTLSGTLFLIFRSIF